MKTHTLLCPPERLEALVARLGNGGGTGDIEAVIAEYDRDPRLHFLNGSLLAGERRYEAGMDAMARALDLQPQYEIARFQLGFLQYTSGDPRTAAHTWAPLVDTHDETSFTLFAQGLMALAADNVPVALDLMERGMLLNQDHPPLNRDIGLLVAEVRRKVSAASEPTSETDLLLRQFGMGSGIQP